MRIVAQVHGFPPHHNAGAEFAMLEMLTWLSGRGHRVDVISVRSPDVYEVQGVKVQPFDRRRADSLYQQADVAITHLDETRAVMKWTALHDLPLFHLVHNDRQLSFHRVKTSKRQIPVFNSEWIKRRVNWSGRSLLMHPPVEPARYRIYREEYEPAHYTLLNLIQAKGSHLFYELAARMPESYFVGVKGSYGHQVAAPDLPNLRILENQEEIKEVYRTTEVLLVPSSYESWGRVAIEAACSGIPVVASPTPGLLESVGAQALFADPESPDQWVKQLRRLEQEDFRQIVSQELEWRASELWEQSQKELLHLEDVMMEVGNAN